MNETTPSPTPQEPREIRPIADEYHQTLGVLGAIATARAEMDPASPEFNSLPQADQKAVLGMSEDKKEQYLKMLDTDQAEIDAKKTALMEEAHARKAIFDKETEENVAKTKKAIDKRQKIRVPDQQTGQPITQQEYRDHNLALGKVDSPRK